MVSLQSNTKVIYTSSLAPREMLIQINFEIFVSAQSKSKWLRWRKLPTTDASGAREKEE